MTFGHVIHILNGATAVACLIGFAPAIDHARDNVDRLYPIGGAVILAAVVTGSIARYDEPPNYRQVLIFVGQLVWITSAWMSRKRRRNRQASS